MKFFGSNAFFAGLTVYSLSDFPMLEGIYTNEGAVQDYDTLNGFQYVGTPSGLYQKKVGTDKWTSLIGGDVKGVVAYNNTLIAITSLGVFFTSDDAKSFSKVKGGGNVKSFFVKGENIYTFGYHAESDGYRLFKANMNDFKPLHVLETVKEVV